MPRKLVEARPGDKAELAKVLRESVERNTGTEVGTGSGPTDLPGVLAEAVAKDDVVEKNAEEEPDWDVAEKESDKESEKESEKEDQEEKEEPKWGHKTGVADSRFGDGRAPTEANWGLEELPEHVTQAEVAFLVRNRPRCKQQEPRVSINLFKQLNWVQVHRRTVLESHGRAPAPR